MNIMKLFSREGIILVLTSTLYACFSILNTNPTWSSLSLLIITAIVAVITLLSCGMAGLSITRFQKNVLLFASYFFLSMIWSINPSDALERGVTVIELCICMTVFLWAYANISDPLTKLLKAVMYGGFIVTLYTYVFVGISNVLVMVAVGDRLDSSFDNVNAIGLICAISIILSVYFLYQKRDWLVIMLDIPTIILLSACGSRKALLVTLVGCMAIYILHNPVKNKMAFALKIVIALILAFVLLQILSQVPYFSGIAERMNGLIAMVTGVGEVDHSTQVREEMVDLGLSLFKENPILGIGMGSAHIHCLRVIGHDCYLHNNYAEILADGGVIGTFLYYRIHLDIITTIKKYNKLTSSDGIIILVLMFCLLISDLSMVSFYSKLYYFFFMIFYVYIKQLNIER